MHVRFDGGEVSRAAAHLESEAAAARRLASAVVGLSRGDEASGDAALAEGLRVLVDVCGDVLEVVGLDLDVLAGKAQAGARAYDATERRLARAAGEGARAP